ncbi:MAG: nitroreductase family protein [Spirochaetaceae bacterium]|jgi:nitroreductase|nr:nitroreductase family protein [Spirochaetaceae bacterium]
MNLRKSICAGLFLCAVISADFGEESIFTRHFAARNFVAGEITQAELDAVLRAGVHAPSANNRQPWHFTVVRSQELAGEMIPNLVSGNIVIVVSAPEDTIKNGRGILDCGLAVENMYLAAQSAGLGSRIYTGPINSVNQKLKSRLDLPKGYSAVALVRIGRITSPTDATSAASPRQPLDTKVTYK